MQTPEQVYSEALDALRQAESNYAQAEDRLIRARRAVKVAEVGTTYYKMLRIAVA